MHGLPISEHILLGNPEAYQAAVTNLHCAVNNIRTYIHNNHSLHEYVITNAWYPALAEYIYSLCCIDSNSIPVSEVLSSLLKIFDLSEITQTNIAEVIEQNIPNIILFLVLVVSLWLG